MNVHNIVTRFHLAGFSDAICAGGAIRDELNKKPIKDFDIFIGHQAGNPIKGRLQATLGVPFRFVCASYGEMGEVNSVWESVGLTPAIQVIELMPGYVPTARVLLMDFGICQCWYDGVRVHYSDKFISDYSTQSFTLVICESQREFDRSMRRWNRLSSEKYQGWTLTIPEQFKQYQLLEQAA